MATKKAGPAPERRSYRCRICKRSIRIPEGWSLGPAVRRHYWRKHREVMQRSSRGSEG
ncbi:MAG: hypothetical protein ACRDJV_03300 [Actinomycetota bacterium]